MIVKHTRHPMILAENESAEKTEALPLKLSQSNIPLKFAPTTLARGSKALERVT